MLMRGYERCLGHGQFKALVFVFSETVSMMDWDTKSTHKESALQTGMLTFGCQMNISSVVETAKMKFRCVLISLSRIHLSSLVSKFHEMELGSNLSGLNNVKMSVIECHSLFNALTDTEV